MRLERQTREHQVALAEADQKLLQTQEELDKVRADQGERDLWTRYDFIISTTNTHLSERLFARIEHRRWSKGGVHLSLSLLASSC